MTKITIEQLTEMYRITYDDNEATICGTDNLLKEIEYLLGESNIQKGQDISKAPPGSYHKTDNPPASFFNSDNNIIIPAEKNPAVPAAKPGITKQKVHSLLDEGFSTTEIAVKLGLTESAILYHEKSYVPNVYQPLKYLADKSVNDDEMPVPSPTEDDQITIPPPSQQQTEPGEKTEFHELKISLPKHMLIKNYGDRRNTDKHNLTYYSSDDGRLIIQYGTNKCYTTWDDLHKLPHPIPGEMLTKLNSQNKMGVKAFKEWMVRQAEMSKTDDPDADFKPLISNYQNTHTDYDGSKLDEVD